MSEFRLGDDLDDYCIKCKRLTNHSILAIVDAQPAKVRCRTCYHEQPYRRCEVPPTKRELKKAELFKQVLATTGAAPEAGADGTGEAAGKAAKKQAAKS
jgi:hypothetical protein